jgi:hypothetical protein
MTSRHHRDNKQRSTRELQHWPYYHTPRLEQALEKEALHRRQHPLSDMVDDSTTQEGVPYCLGSKLTQYMPPDKLYDW